LAEGDKIMAKHFTAPGIDRRTLLGAATCAAATAATGARAQETAATPAVPATPMPPIEAYARSPFIDQIALSPDGKRIAYVTQDGDEKILKCVVAGTGLSRKIPLGKIKARGLLWANNSRVILINSTTTRLTNFAGGKNEFNMAQNIDVDTNALVTLFTGVEGVDPIVTGSVQRLKVDGKYRVSAPNIDLTSGERSVYSFPSEGGKPQDLADGTYYTRDWLVTPDGVPLACTAFNESSKEWELGYNTADAGKPAKFKVIYKIRGTLNYPDLLGLGRDGKSVLICVYTEDADSRYYEVGADGKLSAPVDVTGEGKPRSPLFHPVTGRLAGFLRHNDWFTYDYFDPLMKKLSAAVPQVVSEGYRTAMVDFAEDPRKMIVYGESANDAGSYYFADFTDGSLTSIASNYPSLPEEWITQKKAIQYKAADGLEIHGYLTLPPFKDAKNLPLIVLPHGGPQARDYIDFDWQTQAFASRGYAVLQPNFRGSSGYGSGFVEAGHGEWGGKMQTDLSDGVRWLAAQGIVDPKRVAIFGASYGGYAALAGATLDTGVYTCAVSIAGPSDLKATIEFVRGKSVYYFGSEGVLYLQKFLGDSSRYDALSPARQAAKAYCPILLIHGTDDTVVSIDQSRSMEKALKDAGKPVEFITFQGQDHWETNASTRIAMMQAAVDFIAKYNPA
jgi:dipeptidyl aminopeptidase/acylaminoacyl peptidase